MVFSNSVNAVCPILLGKGYTVYSQFKIQNSVAEFDECNVEGI